MNILVTGANQGIGYYMVEELLKQGHNVTVIDIEITELENFVKKYPGKMLSILCDVRNVNDIQQAVMRSVNTYGNIDIAVHNACLCTFNSMAETDYDVYTDVFNINYFGALRLAKCVVPYMEKSGGGKVIFTSSGVGVMGFVNISPYASTKGAIESLAKCLNIEYNKKGISFHIFHPPLTKTKSASPLPVPKEFMADPKTVGKGLAKNINKRSYIICHSFLQKMQTLACYLMPLKMGRLMSKMTANYMNADVK